MPSGYHHDRREADLGSFSPDRFDRPAESLWHWQVQLGAGMTVFPAGQVRPGLTFALAIRMPATYVTATGRIVYVTSEPDCGGFAYGPLSGHPEQGEEACHVVRDGSRMLVQGRRILPAMASGSPARRARDPDRAAPHEPAYLSAMRAAAAAA